MYVYIYIKISFNRGIYIGDTIGGQWGYNGDDMYTYNLR